MKLRNRNNCDKSIQHYSSSNCCCQRLQYKDVVGAVYKQRPTLGGVKQCTNHGITDYIGKPNFEEQGSVLIDL